MHALSQSKGVNVLLIFIDHKAMQRCGLKSLVMNYKTSWTGWSLSHYHSKEKSHTFRFVYTFSLERKIYGSKWKLSQENNDDKDTHTNDTYVTLKKKLVKTWAKMRIKFQGFQEKTDEGKWTNKE